VAVAQESFVESLDRVVAGSRALDAVLAERRRQAELGHTRGADAALPIWHFVQVAVRLAKLAEKSVGDGLSHAVVRRRLVQLAAFALAAVERIDADRIDGEGSDV
jgi:hypothetical protein